VVLVRESERGKQTWIGVWTTNIGNEGSEAGGWEKEKECGNQDLGAMGYSTIKEVTEGQWLIFNSFSHLLDSRGCTDSSL
jgi:hypothetical protein